MTELAEKLKSLKGASRDKCPMGRLADTLDEETRGALFHVLNSRVATRVIHSELVRAGYKIGRDTIGAHRNGWCCCKKEAQ
jgi:hypothetical protein